MIHLRRTTDHKGRPLSVEITHIHHETWRDLAADGAQLRFELPLHARPASKAKRDRVFWKVVARRRRRLAFDRRTAQIVIVRR